MNPEIREPPRRHARLPVAQQAGQYDRCEPCWNVMLAAQRPVLCTVCGRQVDPALAIAGKTAHPNCAPPPGLDPATLQVTLQAAIELLHDRLAATPIDPDPPPKRGPTEAGTGTCPRCQQPNTHLTGHDRRGRQVCTDCTQLGAVTIT